MAVDRMIGIIGALIALVFWGLSFNYPTETMYYSRFILTLFLTLSILLVISPNQYKEYSFKKLFSQEKVLTILMVIGYVALIKVLGFFVTTLGFTLLYLWVMEKKGFSRYIIFTLSIIAITYFVFAKALFIFFPQGLLI